MKANPRIEISLVGAGTVATALGTSLRRAGYRVTEVVSRAQPESVRRARRLARRVGARAATLQDARFDASLIWICVPDNAIAQLVDQITPQGSWRGKIVAHASGALGSEMLARLAGAGAHVASAHPLMTFVSVSQPDLRGVPFALEGDGKAMRFLSLIVRALGAKPFRIEAKFKAAYHAFGFFSSPAFVELFAAAQQAGKLAGLREHRARELMEPILRQTIDNIFRSTPGQAFSGPLRRGDTATIRKHLEALRRQPDLLEVYRALARVGLKRLPAHNRAKLRRLMDR